MTRQGRHDKRVSRQAAGLCGACGKRPPKPGRKTCQECIDYQKNYTLRNFERVNARLREWRRDKRRRVLGHYGGCCACCGEDRHEFLAIDHIAGHGNEHRREIFGRNAGKGSFTNWLWQQGYPEGFQVLCWNCNAAKAYYAECPHKRENSQ